MTWRRKITSWTKAAAVVCFCLLPFVVPAHGDSTCYGFLGIYQKCTDDATPVIRDFCDRAKELRDLRLTDAEAAALREVNVRKLISLRRKYKRHCPGGSNAKVGAK